MSPVRVSMPWSEAICQTNTGVRMDVCRGLGLVWATVNGEDVAYDSYPVESAPVSAE